MTELTVTFLAAVLTVIVVAGVIWMAIQWRDLKIVKERLGWRKSPR